MLKKALLDFTSSMFFWGILGWIFLIFFTHTQPSAAATLIGSLIIPMIIAGSGTMLLIKLAIHRSILKQRSPILIVGLALFVSIFFLSQIAYKLIIK